jgi:ATP-dependent Lhr-like helicase
MSVEVFNILSNSVQKWIYSQGWSKFRPFQEESIFTIMKEQNDLIISSGTSSGKTEAVFLPILTLCEKAKNKEGFFALCVFPLRSLINDQNKRLADISRYTNVNIASFHSDVSYNTKLNNLNNPSGIMLITPESLESLFINRNQKLVDIFSTLEFIIIDEYHYFLESQRGIQLFSLIKRLEILIKRKIRKIVLSATLSDFRKVKSSLALISKSENIKVIKEKETKGIQLLIKGYEKNEHQRMIKDLYQRTPLDYSSLIFINRRAQIESILYDLLNENHSNKIKKTFYPYYSNVSKSIRQEIESNLRNGKNISVLTSSALELGIDIGNIFIINHIGCSPSVTSLRQRVGRSGRDEEGDMKLFLYITENTESITKTKPKDDNNLNFDLKIELFTAIAHVELLLKGWFESPKFQILNLSVFFQQFVSTLSQYGSMSVSDIYTNLVINGIFKSLTTQQYKTFLTFLKEKEVIKQLNNGELILDKVGDKIANSFDIYTVFENNREFTIKTKDGVVLGSTEDIKQVNDILLFIGKEWHILKVDKKRYEIIVDQSNTKQARILQYSSDYIIKVDDKVRETMLKTYKSAKTPEYLDDKAKELFKKGLDSFYQMQLDNSHFYYDKIKKYSYLFTWQGDRLNITLHCIFSFYNLAVRISPCKSFLIFEYDTNTVIIKLKHILDIFDSDEIQINHDDYFRGKYSEYIEDSLKISFIKSEYLDFSHALLFIKKLLNDNLT